MTSCSGSRWASILAAALAVGLLAGACATTGGGGAGVRTMTMERLDGLIREKGVKVHREGAAWQFTLDGVGLMCIADAKTDRMRFVAPIIPVAKVTGAQLQRTMQANFHAALDARYAVRGGVLYAAFIHPLSALDDDEVRSGMFQVANLVKTFGTTYQSGGLYFGRPAAKKAPTPPTGPTTDI